MSGIFNVNTATQPGRNFHQINFKKQDKKVLNYLKMQL